ncbi:uracil phosphoribosyltransferase [Crocinitomix catalasitica]|nr:uracil phosphoribosyltransferase [Crocinitomix catalasitica]
MKTHLLGNSNSVFNHFIAEIRDKKIQSDPLRFRRNMERIGEIMSYELSKTLDYGMTMVETPLGTKEMSVLREQPVIASILRAGLSMHNGVLNVFDRAENAFISAYRRNISPDKFDIQVEYLACPDLNNKTLILVDPMLATGRSMVMVYKAIQKNGIPAKVHVISAIASRAGMEHVQKHLPDKAELWLGALDEELDAKSYIIPGLGDAGDLAYGLKM